MSSEANSAAIDRLSPPSSSLRRPYIDWLRGVAVLFMIEWHVVDAWMTETARTGPAFTALAFLGGWAAPLFLFLAGVAIPFAAASHQRKGRSVREAAWAVQKRGWQVLLIAHLFRLQSFIFNPWGRWDSIFKPDILNILGLGMVAAAWCWGRSADARRRALWLLIPAAIVVIVTPLVRGWWWPTLLWPRLEGYLRPNGWGQFSLFPWAGFVFAGAAIGTWIAAARKVDDEPAFHRHLALAGLAAIAAGTVTSFIPSPFALSNWWTTSVSFFLIRCGAMTLLLAGAWWVVSRRATVRWSPIILFGQTSLFVYWVHVELAYGMWSAAIRKSLSLPEVALAYGLFTLLMLGGAAWWARRGDRPWIPEHIKA
jgi:uncharacterized membrane protein